MEADDGSDTIELSKGIEYTAKAVTLFESPHASKTNYSPATLDIAQDYDIDLEVFDPDTLQFYYGDNPKDKKIQIQSSDYPNQLFNGRPASYSWDFQVHDNAKENFVLRVALPFGYNKTGDNEDLNDDFLKAVHIVERTLT